MPAEFPPVTDGAHAEIVAATAQTISENVTFCFLGFKSLTAFLLLFASNISVISAASPAFSELCM